MEGRFSEAAAAVVMRGALRALAQCHARGIAYRDVKPDNFLYGARTPTPSTWICPLSSRQPPRSAFPNPCFAAHARGG